MFIVIECWPDAQSAAIVADPESGTNLVFNTQTDAQKEADQCQNGIVIEV